MRISWPRRRWLASLAYALLFASVALLAYFAFTGLRVGPSQEADEDVASDQPIQLGSFSTRIERSGNTERLVVSFKARLTTAPARDVYVYVAARNDHSTPQLWAAWPPQPPTGAFTPGGHLRSRDPTTGYAVKLDDSWQRITAPIVHPRRGVSFDTVIVYVVGEGGEILLARPFALSGE